MPEKEEWEKGNEVREKKWQVCEASWKMRPLHTGGRYVHGNQVKTGNGIGHLIHIFYIQLWFFVFHSSMGNRAFTR